MKVVKGLLIGLLVMLLLTISMILSILIINEIEHPNEDPYPEGRDTVTEFGIGRYVILGGRNAEGEREWCLYDQGDIEGHHAGSIDEVIYGYSKKKPYVYAIGSNGYTKINYEKGEVEQSQDINDYSDDDQKHFRKIEKRRFWFDFPKSDTYNKLMSFLFVAIITCPIWVILLILIVSFILGIKQSRQIKKK